MEKSLKCQSIFYQISESDDDFNEAVCMHFPHKIPLLYLLKLFVHVCIWFYDSYLFHCKSLKLSCLTNN